jgi:hypothetical protein
MSGSESFFSYAKGISAYSFGSLTPLIAFFMIIVIVTIGHHMARFILPMAAMIFGIARKIVQLVLDFIPF